jgi:hypothetical protein
MVCEVKVSIPISIPINQGPDDGDDDDDDDIDDDIGHFRKFTARGFQYHVSTQRSTQKKSIVCTTV